MKWSIMMALAWSIFFLPACGSQPSSAPKDGSAKKSADRTLWTIIVVLSPDVPGPEVFRRICKSSGGTLTYTQEFLTDAIGAVHESALLKCFKRIGPPKEMV